MVVIVVVVRRGNGIMVQYMFRGFGFRGLGFRVMNSEPHALLQLTS